MFLTLIEPGKIEKIVGRISTSLQANPNLLWLVFAAGILIAFTILHLAIFFMDKEEKSNFLYSMFTLYSIFGILIHLIVKPGEELEFAEKFFPMFFHLISWMTTIFLAFLFFPSVVKLRGERRWKMDKRKESLVGVLMGASFGILLMVIVKALGLSLKSTPIVILIFLPAMYFITHKKVGWWELGYILLIPIGLLGSMFHFSIPIIFFQLGLTLFVCLYAIKKKLRGSLVIFAGALLFTSTIFYQIIALLFFNGYTPHIYVLGILALSISMAVYLVVNTVHVQVENAQKSEELEQARQLQLSMLPENAPDHPAFEIAWLMKTATEVGGDYYDYHLDQNGTLTLTLGDATGHGMQAGVVVTATKSLFQNLAENLDITAIFKAISKSLRTMNLKHLGMAMTILKLKDNKVNISSAGIPPVLIFRAKEKNIEEVDINGMPLGLVKKFEYEQRELNLHPGDKLLLMSDGLPERQNANGEEFGYEKTKALFSEAQDRNPQELCEYLISGGEKWASGKLQGDDITFLVVKVK